MFYIIIMDSVIYSEPFKIEGNKEHQYRVTISDNNLSIDYVICDEESENVELILNYEKNLYQNSVTEAKEMISNNIDFRNNKKLLVINDIELEENIEQKQDKIESIDNEEVNILQVINELYEYLINNYFE